MPISGFIPALKFQLANGTVTGFIANKAISFKTQPATTGSKPPAGNYVIHPPVNDPIYGLVALMTPVGSSGSGNAMGKVYISPILTETKINTELAVAKLAGPAFIKTGPLKPKVVFVLTSRPISGQNSLVVTSGFADLLDALQTAGGTTVTVA